ncbi:MAG: PilZ domain-containing protein [Acidobacteriota bacterium]
MAEAHEEAVRRVLVVGSEAPALATVIPLLRRAKFEVATVPDGPEALSTVETEKYDLILVGYPLREAPFGRLLEAIRRKGAPCRNAGVLLLAHQNAFDEAERYLGRGVNRVVQEEGGANRLILIVADLAGEAPRISLRTVVQMDVRIGRERELALYQTENLSSSGMLVRADRTFPVGTRFDFELTLPGQVNPIAGTAEIVRHTDAAHEKVRGFAVRFLSFKADGRDTLESFVAARPR